MMIAIVILGLGMVMVATVFPVAWTRARELSEFTSEETVTDGALITVKMLGLVDGLNSNAGSFAGDLVYNTPTECAGLPKPGDIVAYSDTRVHALHLENIRLAPREFIAEDPYRREQVDLKYPNPDISDMVQRVFGERLFTSAQVRFWSRVHPPMNPRDDFRQPENPTTRLWDATLDTRRFAWAVFHRLRAAVGPEEGPPTDLCENLVVWQRELDAQDALSETRKFEMYLVTLRRPRATNRYAQQDPDPEFLPNPYDREWPAQVQALGPDDDVLFPAPWRVQILLPDELYDDDDPDSPPLGVPTEVSVGRTDDLPTTPLAMELFRAGTPFIDEVNGRVYRVAKRRVAANGRVAWLTLDSQITEDEVDDGDLPNNDNLEFDERLRVVWVFPPPVQAPRLSNGDPVFEGSQPVVGIEVRPADFFPYQ
jgi:hypothetical protein